MTQILSPQAPPQGARRPGKPRRPPILATPEAALEAARALAADYAPGAAERDAERRLPWDEIERHTASGLGAITVPKACGGPGLGYETLVQVFEILSAADGSLGQIPQNHFAVLALLEEAGSPEQKARFYAEVLGGARIGNAGPERRADKAMTHVGTRLRKTAEGWRLDGERFYSTGALYAHWIPTRALDDEGRPVQVWAPHDEPGVAVIDDWDGFGQRTTASGSVKFENVLIRDETQILPIWPLESQATLSGPVSQILQAAIDAGLAAGALEAAVSFLREHARPWVDSGVAEASQDPYAIQEVGRLQIELWAAQALLHEAARRLDEIAAAPVTPESSAEASVVVAQAKILTTEIALDASEKLFELAGSSATRAGYGLGRIWRDARVHTLHDPVRWKRHLLGAYALNGTLPARHQWN